MSTRIRVEPAGYETTDEAPLRMMEFADRHPGAKVPFGCRSASCGTCRVEVLEGAEALAPPADEELDVLDIFADDPAKVRLCCQIKLTRPIERLTLRVVDPEP